MSTNARSDERRGVLATARRYRRDGYKVIGPDEWPDLPEFLGDLVPDLIAERADDRVVIEVKRADAVPGTNEIVELARRVASQPGWRFELIGLQAPSKAVMPDLGRARHDVQRLIDQSFPGPAFVLVCAVIENLAAYASVLLKRRPEKLPLRELVRELLVHGFIDEDAGRRIGEALARRNVILHDANAPPPTRNEVEALLKIGQSLERELHVLSETSTDTTAA